MTKRKPSTAKKRAVKQTPATTRPGRESRGRTQDRTAHPTRAAASVVDADEDVFIPSAPTLPDEPDEEVFVPTGFQFMLPLDAKPLGLPRDIDAALNESFNYSPRLSPGFDVRGKCAHGCDGMVSLKDPLLGMHEYSCPFWDTADGIRLMLRFEKQDFPPFK